MAKTFNKITGFKPLKMTKYRKKTLKNELSISINLAKLKTTTFGEFTNLSSQKKLNKVKAVHCSKQVHYMWWT